MKMHITTESTDSITALNPIDRFESRCEYHHGSIEDHAPEDANDLLVWLSSFDCRFTLDFSADGWAANFIDVYD